MSSSAEEDDWICLLNLGNADAPGSPQTLQILEQQVPEQQLPDPMLRYLLENLDTSDAPIGGIPGDPVVEEEGRIPDSIQRRIQLEMNSVRVSHHPGIGTSSLAPLGNSFDTLVAHAENVIRHECMLVQPAMYKIGICASPLQRFTHPTIGYEQDGYVMVLLAASDSSQIADLEKHLVDMHIGSDGCQNVAAGGGGRCPPGCASFLYVVVKQWRGLLPPGATHAPPAAEPRKRQRCDLG
jgi:hypothetical protein